MGICFSVHEYDKNIRKINLDNPEINNGIVKEICKDKPYIQNSKISKASKAICKISFEMNNQKAHATGFFMEVFLSNNIYRFLVTNYHVISKQLINKKIELELHNQKIVYLNLELKNIRFFDGIFDVTTIQINDDLSEIIEIVDFLDCDMNY